MKAIIDRLRIRLSWQAVQGAAEDERQRPRNNQEHGRLQPPGSEEQHELPGSQAQDQGNHQGVGPTTQPDERQPNGEQDDDN
jgi:hypothetical protein